MGGFVLEAPGLEEPIPLDAEQLFYLVERKYVEFPKISKDEIDDKDKSDGLSRLFYWALHLRGLFAGPLC